MHYGILTLYGLFDSACDCQYVGRTLNCFRRRDWHHKRTPLLTFRILRQAEALQSNRLERQMIAAYRKRGQCRLNKQAGGSGLKSGVPVLWIEGGILFASAACAASFFDCSATSIIHHAKTGEQTIDGATFRRA